MSLSVLCPSEDWDEVEVAETSDSTISASSATLLRLREVRSARALEMEILTLSQVLLFFPIEENERDSGNVVSGYYLPYQVHFLK